MEKNYSTLSDVSLLKLIRNKHDELAFNELVKRYTPAMHKFAKEMYALNQTSGISKSELLAVCLSSLYAAANKVKLEENVAFYFYYQTTCNHDMVSYIRKNSYLDKASFFSGSSLDDDHEGLSLANILGCKDEYQMSINEIYEIINDGEEFSKIDSEVLRLFILGYSLKEIATRLKVSLSDVYYHYGKSIKKLRVIIGQRYFK